MANDEHVALLKQGVKAWNAWRRENPDIRPDLSNADLRGADLSGANLARANLREAFLFKANLGSADLVEANLRDHADLSGADLARANLREAFHAGEHAVTVDNIEVAQFVYLLLHNEKIRDVIDTIGKKGVLLLGRFTEGRMVVLERLRENSAILASCQWSSTSTSLKRRTSPRRSGCWLACPSS